MPRPLIQIGDEVRQMTETEYAQHIADTKQQETQHETQLAKAAARTSALAKLAALGLTNDEIAALLP